MFENKEGQRVPEVTFRTRKGSDWIDVTTKDIFAGKNVVVFSLPGAFTPTCSSTHVPRYNDLSTAFRKQGIDDIVCVSVNDAFVMNEWRAQQDASRITFIPDGNGEFTKGMGMLVNRSELGFGDRSWRYSMLVRDGVVEKMFIEPEEDGDPFYVSDAETMLGHIAPGTEKPLDVAILSRDGCTHCDRARQLLGEHGIDFAELKLLKDYPHRAIRAMSGGESLPQVFINGDNIGGAEQLESWLSKRAAA